MSNTKLLDEMFRESTVGLNMVMDGARAEPDGPVKDHLYAMRAAYTALQNVLARTEPCLDMSSERGKHLDFCMSQAEHRERVAAQ